MSEQPPELTPVQIDAVLRFLPMLEQPDYSPGEWSQGGYQMPYYSYRPDFDAFIDALYDQGVVFAFDWMTWQDEAKRYRTDSAALESADLLAVRKLLTAHVRADRFVEGHLAAVFAEGHLTAILQRLKQLRARMTD